MKESVVAAIPIRNDSPEKKIINFLFDKKEPWPLICPSPHAGISIGCPFEPSGYLLNNIPGSS
jgi:hypothetical protein